MDLSLLLLLLCTLTRARTKSHEQIILLYNLLFVLPKSEMKLENEWIWCSGFARFLRDSFAARRALEN
jgi:hypothetical protein